MHPELAVGAYNAPQRPPLWQSRGLIWGDPDPFIIIVWLVQSWTLPLPESKCEIEWSFVYLILHSCCIIVSTVRWTWWDWSLVLRTYLPSVLWHCWLGHLTGKNSSQIWPIMFLVGCWTILSSTTLICMSACLHVKTCPRYDL